MTDDQKEKVREYVRKKAAAHRLKKKCEQDEIQEKDRICKEKSRLSKAIPI